MFVRDVEFSSNKLLDYYYFTPLKYLNSFNFFLIDFDDKVYRREFSLRRLNGGLYERFGARHSTSDLDWFRCRLRGNQSLIQNIRKRGSRVILCG